MHRTESYSNELGSILNQRTLARRTQDVVPATFFSAVEFLLTHDMALLARVSPCLFKSKLGSGRQAAQVKAAGKAAPARTPGFPPY